MMPKIERHAKVNIITNCHTLVIYIHCVKNLSKLWIMKRYKDRSTTDLFHIPHIVTLVWLGLKKQINNRGLEIHHVYGLTIHTKYRWDDDWHDSIIIYHGKSMSLCCLSCLRVSTCILWLKLDLMTRRQIKWPTSEM